MVVFLAALWRHGGATALGHALVGVAVGVLFVYLLGPALHARSSAIRPARRSTIRRAPSRFLPAFQVGLYLALWVAAFIAICWPRFVAGLAVLGLTQTAGLLALHVVATHAGLTAHVRDVRAWAVAGPLLIFAAVVTCARRVAEAPAVSALATLVTVAIAAPVLRAPSERLFGMEIVGRHHDPFTVMEQFERPISVGVYSQPLTDIPGALLARLPAPVAAYNWIVLLSFPLAAAAAYLLARHLALSPAGATVAAMAYAFSPFHLAHAAYHPHVAQMQWLPLYLLALWRCLDRASPPAVAFSPPRRSAVTLSNFYAGPDRRRHYAGRGRAPTGSSPAVDRQPFRRLRITVTPSLIIAAAGIGYAFYAAGDLVANRDGLRLPARRPVPLQREVVELSRAACRASAARRAAHRFWTARRRSRRAARTAGEPGLGDRRAGARRRLALDASRSAAASLVCRPGPASSVAVVALICSLSPERTVAGFTVLRPSALLYALRADVPIVRALRGRRAAHGGAAGGHRLRLPAPERNQAGADRRCRAAGPGRRRIRGRAVRALA